MFTLIDNFDDFKLLNSELLDKSCIGVDTEFRRTSRDNIRLSLIQINDSEETYIVDCLKININDLDFSNSFLSSEKVMKVFHSCKEDIDAIYSWSKSDLTNLFDTQIANAIIGGALSVSYQDLVLNELGVAIDKKETRSNWIKRPLSDSQLRYAASDVQFLLNLSNRFIKKLEFLNRQDWLTQEIELLFNNPLISTSDEIRNSSNLFTLNRIEENRLLEDFNKVVSRNSTEQNINKVLLFSKKNQKIFVKVVLSKGLKEAFKLIPKWKTDLLNEPISDLFNRKGLF
tara:strand:+ start:41341 stop:42198 length:858 start_codon:yes stop_codon:yes gene_type:complete